MRIRRRRNEAEPVVLPSLDRLSGLIERVVELVDAVGDAKEPAPETGPETGPEPVVEAPRDASAEAEREAEREPAPSAGWVAFVSSAQGYRLKERPGPAPAPGDAVVLDGAPYRVVKTGPSPLPGDRRRCAYVVGEEPPDGGRMGDA